MDWGLLIVIVAAATVIAWGAVEWVRARGRRAKEERNDPATPARTSRWF
jgi:hypothetical protein